MWTPVEAGGQLFFWWQNLTSLGLYLLRPKGAPIWSACVDVVKRTKLKELVKLIVL